MCVRNGLVCQSAAPKSSSHVWIRGARRVKKTPVRDAGRRMGSYLQARPIFKTFQTEMALRKKKQWRLCQKRINWTNIYMCGRWLVSVSLCVFYFERQAVIRLLTRTQRSTCTHHEEDAEVGQFSKEVLHADWVGVKRKVVADALVEFLHVLVHCGQFFILLPGMFAEAVRRSVKGKLEQNVFHTKYFSFKML